MRAGINDNENTNELEENQSKFERGYIGKTEDQLRIMNQQKAEDCRKINDVTTSEDQLKELYRGEVRRAWGRCS